MKSVSPDIFGSTPLEWFLLPLLCLMLIHLGNRTGRRLDTALRITSSTLVVLVTVAMARL